jgi:hypothetical protein
MSADTPRDKTGSLSDSIAETQAAILHERKVNEALLNLVRVIQPTPTKSDDKISG